jgi:phage gp29-like protein
MGLLKDLFPSKKPLNLGTTQATNTAEGDMAQATPGELIRMFAEYGVTGLDRYSGYVFEDFMSILRYPHAAKIYDEMSNNDPVIASILFLFDQMTTKADWSVKPASQSPADLEAAEFIEQNMHSMSIMWKDIILNAVSSLEFGFAFMEITYEMRDGKICWRKWANRSQKTLVNWEFSTSGSIKAFVQQAPPANQEIRIPLSKGVLFRTTSRNDNPEGRSLLRGAYRPWYFKKRIEELEAIGIERDLVGIPKMVPPEALANIWATDDPKMIAYRQAAESTMKDLRMGTDTGIIIPPGWEVELMKAGGSKQIDTHQVIGRKSQEIAITLLSDIVLMGGDKVGSFALADVKKSLLAVALEVQLQRIADVINKYGVEVLCDLNLLSQKEGFTGYPKVNPGEVETPDTKVLGDFVLRMSKSGIHLGKDPAIVDYLLKVASMPASEVDLYEKEQKVTTPDESDKEEDDLSDDTSSDETDSDETEKLID